MIVNERVIDLYISEDFVLFFQLIQLTNLGVFSFLETGVLGVNLLRPIDLLGLSHSLFCGLFVNVLRWTCFGGVIRFIVNVGVNFVIFGFGFD